MLITNMVEITVGARNLRHYRNLGYDVKMGDKITVNIEDIPKSSHTKITYKCDMCGELKDTEVYYWNSRTYAELGDYCRDCAIKIKLPKAMEDIYGYSNAANVPEIIEKKKSTNIDKYGNEWAIASDVVRGVALKSIYDKYGVYNVGKSSTVREKTRQTMLERYGVEYTAQSIELRDKMKNTCLIKYGVENIACLPEFREKMQKTLCANGTYPTSKAEQTVSTMLQEMYGKNNCFPHYAVGKLSLDCLLIINGIKIDVEYDGWYWHKDRANKDIARNAVLMKEGYKIIRIKADRKDTIPTNEQISNAVDYLVNSDHHLAFIDMNN